MQIFTYKIINFKTYKTLTISFFSTSHSDFMAHNSETSTLTEKINKIDIEQSQIQKSVSGNSNLEIKHNLKRKFHSNLINPNIKKRKNKGYTFIQEEEDDNKEEE